MKKNNLSENSGNNTGILGLQSLAATLPIKGCVMGIDSGKQRWGIAISDDERKVSLPLVQYVRKKYVADLAFLKNIITERHIHGVVIGLPIHMNGQSSPRGQAAMQLGRDIEQKLTLPVVFWDERLSTVAMERSMIEVADLSRAKRHNAIDKLAATFILQGALDAMVGIQSVRRLEALTPSSPEEDAEKENAYFDGLPRI